MEKTWFEMRDVIRRKYADSVWIPLNVIEQETSGKIGRLEFKEDWNGVDTLAVHLAQRAEGEELTWSSITSDHEPCITQHGYKPAEVYERRDGEALGIALVLVQSWPGVIGREWQLNQDLVIALGLKREGDIWRCPNEGFVDVAKLTRNEEGNPKSIVIRADFLRDYLAARSMALRIMSYRGRQEILEDTSDTGWGDEPVLETIYGGRFEGRAGAIHEGGMPFGGKTSVLHMARIDVDTDADIPVMGPETDHNVRIEHSVHNDQGRKLYRIHGEFWRDEWVEPAIISPRVRGDHVPSSISFFSDASGTKTPSDNLRDEDIGKWLWFTPNVINTILELQGSSLSWYTRETGSVHIVRGYPVHFGINEKGLITIYAYDIAKLPEWQKSIWAGFNIIPDGGVSKELMQSQVEADPARTQAPEEFFKDCLDNLNKIFTHKWGKPLLKPLLKPHELTENLHKKIHRFRSLNEAGLLALAKDIARLTADSIEVGILHTIVPLKKDERRGSLKSLQAVVETIMDPVLAKKIVGTLIGIYELRFGDAHLPSKELDEAKALAGINFQASYMQQGYQMLRMAVSALDAIGYHIALNTKNVTVVRAGKVVNQS